MSPSSLTPLESSGCDGTDSRRAASLATSGHIPPAISEIANNGSHISAARSPMSSGISGRASWSICPQDAPPATKRVLAMAA